MAKQRSVPITNSDIIDKLCHAGVMGPSDIQTKENNMCTVHEKARYRSNEFPNQYGNYFYASPTHSYMIPLSIYREHVTKRFRVVYPIGSQVRMRKNSSRTQRRSYTQDVGDTYNWEHIGIGSGKEYLGEDVSDALNEGYTNSYGQAVLPRWRRTYNRYQYDMRILIGNGRYVPNVISARNQANYFNSKGIKPNTNSYWGRSTWKSTDFFRYIEIKGDGFFGPKKLINGYISEIYVHFLYPTWATKRESRYEVTFDTGARGIFTSDYLDRVYDTDLDLDFKMMAGCENASECPWADTCDHTDIHMYTEECEKELICSKCKPIVDYTNLFNTTHGKALDYDIED